MSLIDAVCIIIAFVAVVGAIAYSRETDRLSATNVATAVEAAKKACAEDLRRATDALAQATTERDEARGLVRSMCDAKTACDYQHQEKLDALRSRHAAEIAGRDRLDEAIRRRWRRVDERAMAANPGWRTDPEVAAAVDRLLEALDGDSLVEATPVPERSSAPAQSGPRAKAAKRESANG